MILFRKSELRLVYILVHQSFFRQNSLEFNLTSRIIRITCGFLSAFTKTLNHTIRPNKRLFPLFASCIVKGGAERRRDEEGKMWKCLNRMKWNDFCSLPIFNHRLPKCQNSVLISMLCSIRWCKGNRGWNRCRSFDHFPISAFPN